MAGSNNDLDVLQASPIFNDILQDKATDMSYVVNGDEYKYGYYLGDEIYLECVTFDKSYTFMADDKRKMFKLAQESARKDVERAMIIEEEGRAICSYTTNDILNPPVVIQVGSLTYLSRVLEIQNRETHHNLRHDLIEYIWERQFQGQNGDEDEENDDGDEEEDEDGDDDADDAGDDNDND
ncbi:phosphopantothenoylcysteine decarboxylase subunit VHS3-like [Lactuca sativa]|uniref:phosphopantothenoylcysteine decarboxylase subunit VHS3-like n=1 Tax=Lactuca sativa TaxID=4236 RepID=UPI000CD9334B|nr:phosphopantothenoylcysteine decarboxylase subunit VHS3-like [Lactuca sativa]